MKNTKKKATKAKAAVKRPKTIAKAANRSSGQSRTAYSGRQVHQDHLQPDWREGMPPLRSDDLEGT